MVINNYQQIIKKLIQSLADLHKNAAEKIEIVFDEERHHYLMIQVGWFNDHWVYGCLLHLDIINDKIYIQQNNTEVMIADELVNLGVPKTDIVIGFHSPFKRQFTEYAIS